MSLLDGLLRDALLQNVVQSDVYIAIRTDNPGNATPIGSGTVSDPFGGPADSGDWFDVTMAAVGANRTVRLGPGVFATKGSTGTSSGSAFAVQSGMRILGSGIAETKIKLVNVPASSSRYVLGMDFAGGGSGLDGFEMSDLQLLCNLSGNTNTAAAAGALRIRGRNLFVHRVQISDYGTRAGGTTINVATIAGENSENCVFHACSADPLSAASTGKAVVFAFEGTTNGHRFCAIRNCTVQGLAGSNPIPAVAADNLRGISPGLGLGTIIEENAISSCAVAVDATGTANDVIIRKNYFWNVWCGIRFQNDTLIPLGRLIMVENVIDGATTSGSLANPLGIALASIQTAPEFSQVIIRKNVIRDVQAGAGALAAGIDISRCSNASIESNVINSTSVQTAVRYASCTTVKAFNNQTTAGQLRHAFSVDQNKSIQELEDAVQDVLLPL